MRQELKFCTCRGKAHESRSTKQKLNMVNIYDNFFMMTLIWERHRGNAVTLCQYLTDSSGLSSTYTSEYDVITSTLLLENTHKRTHTHTHTHAHTHTHTHALSHTCTVHTNTYTL